MADLLVDSSSHLVALVAATRMVLAWAIKRDGPGRQGCTSKSIGSMERRFRRGAGDPLTVLEVGLAAMTIEVKAHDRPGARRGRLGITREIAPGNRNLHLPIPIDIAVVVECADVRAGDLHALRVPLGRPWLV